MSNGTVFETLTLAIRKSLMCLSPVPSHRKYGHNRRKVSMFGVFILSLSLLFLHI
ncbi:hypothetical protein BDZ91DRAFT_720741 [Kalaharituber pfeilii]|nr:hypothetical protein BDZ91DRAFT_720741 [Kalaharituber pfeilii]